MHYLVSYLIQAVLIDIYTSKLKTVRVAPPAITPLPGAEGRKIRRAPKQPVVACGIEFAPVNGTVITCFLPSATAFLQH